MKSDLVKLFDYRGVQLYIDFTRLFEHEGKKNLRYKNEKRVGNTLIVTSIALYILNISLLILEGQFAIDFLIQPHNLLNLGIYLLIIPILIGFFLKRDRNYLELNHKKIDLNKILTKSKSSSKISKIIINDTFDLETSLLLNQIYLNKEQYTKFLLEKLISDARFNNILTKRLGLDSKIFFDSVENSNELINFDEDYPNFFSRVLNEALLLNVHEINLFVIFFVLLKYYFHKNLIENKVTDIEFEGLRRWYANTNQEYEYEKRWRELSKLKPVGDVNSTYTSTITPVLDKFGKDLTNQVRNREFHISIGRDEEIAKLLGWLERDSATFIYLVGDNGVGKSSLIKYLATRMVVDDVPNILKDSRLVVVNFNKLVADAKSIDELKDILPSIFKEVVRSKNILLIADNFSSIFSLKSDLKDEAKNLLKSILDNKLNFIAIDEPLNYQKYIKNDLELASKFDLLELKEVQPQIALQILADESLNKEKKYHLNIQFSALKRIVDYAYKFDYEKKMPQKGLDLLEESLIISKNKGYDYLDAAIVEELLYSKLGVKLGSVNKDEQTALLNLEEDLGRRVIGQNDAISSVVAAIKRSRSGLSNQKKPIASFLFYGPTGVGKTELAKALADLYYGSENLMVRIDMSEYQEENNLIRLIGGYNSDGTYTKGFLADTIRSRPFSLVLLDEIEKANPKVLDLFLSVLDDGFFKDGMDRKVDFTNTIIIMTSNLGTKEIENLYEHKHSYEELKRKSIDILSKYLRPEFLNRFDKLILFKHLSLMEVTSIVDKFLNEINLKLAERGIKIYWNSKTLEELAKFGYSPVWGARELRRIIQEKVEDILADQIISGNIKEGDQIYLNGLSISEIK